MQKIQILTFFESALYLKSVSMPLSVSVRYFRVRRFEPHDNDPARQKLGLYGINVHMLTVCPPGPVIASTGKNKTKQNI